MPELESPLLGASHIELLGALMQQPHLLQISLDVLAIQEMSEDELILNDGLVAENEGERPLN